jgi:branched-chain amino acid transport system substrate-binding protein
MRPVALSVLALSITVTVGLSGSAGLAVAQMGQEPVKVGVLTDMNSIYADITGMGSVEAARMAAEDAGEVLGRPVSVTFADNGLKPDQSMAIARRWYENEGVDAILDVAGSSVALAVHELTREKKKVMLASGAGTTELTGPKCSPYTAQWTFDTYALAHSTGLGVLKSGGDTWFELIADYAYGFAAQKDLTDVITQNGGKVLGVARHPVNTADFSSFLLQAQASGAKIVGLGNAGNDMTNSIKQASEFGLQQKGQKLVGLLTFITDVHSLGLKTAQGLLLTESFYWDQDDQTRAWSQRYYKRMGKMPSMDQAGVYSATMHYLKAVKAVGNKNSDLVMAKMREMPVNDFMTKNGHLRVDGRLVRDMYLFEVKKPEESHSEWDLYKLIRTIPGNEAYRPLSEGGCPLASATKP